MLSNAGPSFYEPSSVIGTPTRARARRPARMMARHRSSSSMAPEGVRPLPDVSAAAARTQLRRLVETTQPDHRWCMVSVRSGGGDQQFYAKKNSARETSTVRLVGAEVESP